MKIRSSWPCIRENTFVLDQAWAFAILIMVITFSISHFTAPVEKARMVNVLMLIKPYQIDVAENIAIDGVSGLGAALQPKSRLTPEIKPSIDDARAMKLPAKKTTETSEQAPPRDDYKKALEEKIKKIGLIIPGSSSSADTGGNYKFRTESYSIIASGPTLFLKTDFELPFSPAIPDTSIPWNIIWLCGQHQAPTDWSSLDSSIQTNLPVDALFAVCRKTKDR